MRKIILILFLSFITTEIPQAQNVNQPQSVSNDWKLTKAGLVRQLIVNRGRLYKWNTDYPGLIDCEYPPGSNEEHVARYLLWMSGISSNGDTLSNGPDDAWPTSARWDTIWVVDKGEPVDIPYWPNYQAASDQDFVFRYNDYLITEFGRDEPHVPLHIDVIGTVYTWAARPLNEVLLWTWRVIPVKTNIIDFYLTVTNESKIGQVQLGAGGDDRSLYIPELMMSAHEDGPGGRDGDAIGAMGFQFFLPKGYPEEEFKPTWLVSNYYFDFLALIETDGERYKNLISSGHIMRDEQTYDGSSVFFSAGPFDINLGDTLTLTMAQVLGRGLEGVIANAELLKFLQANDFRAPSAPPVPPIVVETGNKEVKISWAPTDELNPEAYSDPYRADGEQNPFEGYRLYKSSESSTGPWSLLAEYDLPENNHGQNIGLAYEYTDIGLLNNIDYYYAVTAFSKPDSVLNWESQESSIFQGSVKVIVGPKPPESVGEVAVIPNPYRGDISYDSYNPPWERPSAGREWLEQDRRLQFINLPDHCEIKIFTLAGDFVDRIEHNDPKRGFHDWNLTSTAGQAVASGLYLFTVEDLTNGNVQVGKFVIIK